MNTNEDNQNTEGGNNQPPPKKDFQSRKWVFTLNNYTDNEEKAIFNYLNTKSKKFIYGFESGEEGTPHLQGYMEFERPIKYRTLHNNGFDRCYLTNAKGDLKKNYDYCSKQCNYKYGGFKPEKVKFIQKIDKFYEWEEEIIKSINEYTEDRFINWIWEPNGCAGKTTFQKWIYTHYDNVVVLSGKSADMKNGIIEYIKKNQETPDIVLINIPRSIDNKYVSMEGIESIKDMFFFSGKYEGGMVCGMLPQIWIFANRTPDTSMMSPDRWRIRQILNDKLI